VYLLLGHKRGPDGLPTGRAPWSSDGLKRWPRRTKVWRRRPCY